MAKGKGAWKNKYPDAPKYTRVVLVCKHWAQTVLEPKRKNYPGNVDVAFVAAQENISIMTDELFAETIGVGLYPKKELKFAADTLMLCQACSDIWMAHPKHDGVKDRNWYDWAADYKERTGIDVRKKPDTVVETVPPDEIL